MNKLEEQMNELMNGASLKDLMPGFDKEAFWTEVAAQVPEQQPKKKKAIIPLGWVLRVAAVLLIGIGIWSAVRFSGSHSVVTEETAAITTPSSSPIIIKQPAVIAAPQEAAAVIPANNIARITKQVFPVKMMPQQQPQNVQPQVNVPHIISEPRLTLNTPVTVETPVAVAKKKVTHYLDIDDDTAPAATASNVATAPFIQIKLNKPGTAEQHLQQKPFKELTLALAR